MVLRIVSFLRYAYNVFSLEILNSSTFQTVTHDQRLDSQLVVY